MAFNVQFLISNLEWFIFVALKKLYFSITMNIFFSFLHFFLFGFVYATFQYMTMWLYIFTLNSNDNEIIKVDLDGMGYSHRLYKKTIPNNKFIKGQFQSGIFFKKNLQFVIFQNVLMDPKISKKKQFLIWTQESRFKIFWNINIKP